MEIISNNKTATNTVEVEFKASAEEFEQAVQAAYLKKKKNINVPGFRKGKAPRKIIEAEYGEGVFYEDAVNGMYQKSVAEVIDELKLEVVDMPNIEVTEVSKENGVSFKATFTTKPEVEIKDYKGIKVNKTVKNVTDEDVANELKRYQEKDARIIDVTDRPLQKGDTAVFDFEGFVDGEAFEGGKGTDYPLTIGSHSFIDTFEEQLIGAKIGKEVEVNVTFPENYQAENLAGKAATFKVVVKAIKAKELPKLDDEFAQEVSEFDTLADYKADIKKNLTEKKKEAAKSERERLAVAAAVENATMEIPDAMVKTQVNRMIEDFAQRLQSQGLSMEQYMQYVGGSPEQFMETMKPEATTRIKNSLVLEAVAEAEKIEVTEADIDAEIEKMASMYNMEVEKVKEFIGDTEKDQIKKDLAVQKAAELLGSKAVEKAPKKAEDEE